MKKLITLLFLSCIICGCNDHKAEKIDLETVDYYSNNSNVIFRKNIAKTDFDSVFYFYENGNLFKRGKQTKEGHKFGNWELYDNNSNLREIREYFYVQGDLIINRAWFLNNTGDTLAYRKENGIFDQKEFINDTINQRNSSYNTFNFITNDTIDISDHYFAFASCGSPLLRDYESKILVVVDNTNSLKKDFSNIASIKMDTFYYAKIDTIHNTNFDNYDLEKVAAFSGKFKSEGEKIIRGYMLEYTDKYPADNNEMAKAESRTYFEKTIFVTDQKK